jgi:uncharacterized membrane-anchored protein
MRGPAAVSRLHVGVRLALVLIVQLGLVGLAVAPQLSARATGEEYLMSVAPVDPIDPLRGAYVDLVYPDVYLTNPEGSRGDPFDGTVYVRLVERDGLWVNDGFSTSRPEDGPYLTCDDRTWRMRCGIESWFLPQEEAAAFQELVRDGGAVARVKIDSRGHAALVDVQPR